MNVEGAERSLETRFFFKRLTFECSKLEIEIADDTRVFGTICFEYVRTFFLFKESDFFLELAKYEHEQVISGGERTLGVFRILRSPIIAPILGGRFESEGPGYFWVSTPDECLEVVAFGEPVLLAPDLSL